MKRAQQHPAARLHVLPNGLRVVAVALPHLSTGHAALFTRAGPRHETDATHGLSHFVEHMLFRGCGPWRTSREVALHAESFMGSLEGTTWRDHAVYATAFRRGGADDAVALLGQMMRAPRFAHLAPEKSVILEEIGECFDEDGAEIDPDNLARAALYPAHPAGRSIDGSLQSVARFGRRQLWAHHHRFHVGRNLVLAVAGDVDPARVTRLARRHLGALPAGTAPGLPGGTPVPLRRPRLVHVRQPGPQTQLRLSFATPGARHPDAWPLQLLRRVLDDGFASRLQAELVDRAGLAYELWAEVDLGEDAGAFDFGALVTRGKEVRTLRALLREVDRLARHGPGRAELARARQRFAYGLEQMHDHAASVAEWHGRGTLFGLPTDPRAALRLAAAVTPAAVRRVAAAVFRAPSVVATAIGAVPRAELSHMRALLVRRGGDPAVRRFP
ncbi:MAG: insulinase family protein [Deltaproteobacteria bacterium]|nr:insulinase family protein [Deltaproteobacteria bacterium]